jgi:hypothetical protein
MLLLLFTYDQEEGSTRETRGGPGGGGDGQYYTINVVP